MSLEDLLKDTESDSQWKDQRKKIIRIILGILIISIALIGIVFIVFTLKKDPSEKEKLTSESKKEQEAQSLAKLIQLQQETKSLQQEINRLKKNPSSFSTTSNKKAVDNINDKVGNSDDVKNQRSIIKNKDQQIITPGLSNSVVNFDPGETAFTVLRTNEKDVYIPTGAVFQARLITPIKTSVVRTFVIAETTNDFRMDMDRQIPKGSRLIGNARLNAILKGVVVEFETLVLPDGMETRINALALSRNALPEIEGLYFSNDLEKYGTALAFGFLSGFSEAAQERETTPFGSQPEVSVNNQVLSGLSRASFQVAEDILRDIRSQSVEYVVVPAGEAIFVALTRRYDIKQEEVKK